MSDIADSKTTALLDGHQKQRATIEFLFVEGETPGGEISDN